MIELAPDIPRFYTAIAEWLAWLIVVLVFARKVRCVRFVAVAGVALIVQAAWLYLTNDLPVGFWLPVMGVSVGLMFAFIKAVAGISLQDCAYHCVRAFIAAEFAASFEWQVQYFIWPHEASGAFLPGVPFLVGVYAATFGVFFVLERQFAEHGRKLNASTRELVSAIAMGVAVFALSNLSYVTIATPFSSAYGREIMNIRTVVDLGGLAILYAHYTMCREHRAESEVAAISGVLRAQSAQYQTYKESVEIINQKHHDLKHQIAALRAEPDAAAREAFLDDMERKISVHEAQNKTGNPILDTILTSKSLYCRSEGISLTCVADGALLDFIDAMDICVLFGNALDNAIESSEKLADEKKRLICLTVARQKDFLIIKIENYFEGGVDFHDGLPVTTKTDSDYHGYGLKSIRAMVKKYDGTMSVETSDGWFVLNLLIPLPDAS
ncbi:MAG: ATP-binding protein [Propionibacteriaceae bacterium]|jgi:hypothetical protein|nr:ATP-binding protein [Propionibacteriaceae bacterium]